MDSCRLWLRVRAGRLRLLQRVGHRALDFLLPACNYSDHTWLGVTPGLRYEKIKSWYTKINLKIKMRVAQMPSARLPAPRLQLPRALKPHTAEPRLRSSPDIKRQLSKACIQKLREGENKNDVQRIPVRFVKSSPNLNLFRTQQKFEESCRQRKLCELLNWFEWGQIDYWTSCLFFRSLKMYHSNVTRIVDAPQCHS